MSITVVIIEDQEIIRFGLKTVLGASEEIEVVGLAESAAEGLEKIRQLNPKVVIMDIGLPDINGIEATKLLRTESSPSRVVMLTSHEDDDHVFAALGSGADGYCLKEISREQLILAIKTVAEGAAWLDPRIANRVLRNISVNRTVSSANNETSSNISLTPREFEVLRLVVDGKTNQEIAESLVLGIETVKTHMRHIMEKLMVSDRTQAAVKALKLGIL